MKKALLVVLATLFIASFAYAKDYIGVYFDGISTHSLCTKTISGDIDFNYYVHVKPEPRGLTAVEFKIVFPPIIYDMDGMVVNANINLQLGEITTDWSATFANCQYTWTQVYRQHVYANADVWPNGVIMIAPGDESGTVALSNCSMIDSQFTILNHGHINLPCIIGTKDASWGAIKSLF
jgi:hypothetical protein